jgi:hypothetical protein
MRRLQEILLGAALVGAAALPAVADANRPADASERAGLVADLAIPAEQVRCLAFLASNVPVGEAWARVQPIVPAPPGCSRATPMFTIARLSTAPHSRWSTFLTGAGDRRRSCADARIPDDVGEDLDACASSRTLTRGGRRGVTLACFPGAAAVTPDRRRRPSTCLVRGADATGTATPGAPGYDLRGLRWTGWGTARATATGRASAVRGSTVSRRRVRVRLVATGLGSQGTTPIYMRLRVSPSSGPATLTLP